MEEINSKQIRGFDSIEEDIENNKIIITINNGVTEIVFLRIMEFLYSGYCIINNKDDMIAETMVAAETYQCEELVTICQNILDDQSDLNPSFETYLNDQTGEMSKKLFFNNKLLSDVTFQIEGNKIFAHKAVISARCKVLSTMFSAGFIESKNNIIDIGDTTIDSFLAFLEFIYTSHSPIEESEDSVGILCLANQFGMTRLVTLCELYISKEVDKATTDNIEKAEIDVIGLLIESQRQNANQLASFCLHFISTNYQPFLKRSEFKHLEGENLKFVQDHQWPPVSYLNQLEVYEKEMKAFNKDDKCVIM